VVRGGVRPDKEMMTFVERVPQWARWAIWWFILLPGSIWLAGRFEHLFDAAIGLSAADRTSNLPGIDVRIIASQLVSAIPFTVLPAMLSPRPVRVASVIVGFWALLGFLPVAYRIGIGYVFSEILAAVASMAADVVGSFAGLLAVKSLVRLVPSSPTRAAPSESVAPEQV
jgi:hypothetical protein